MPCHAFQGRSFEIDHIERCAVILSKPCSNVLRLAVSAGKLRSQCRVAQRVCPIVFELLLAESLGKQEELLVTMPEVPGVRQMLSDEHPTLFDFLTHSDPLRWNLRHLIEF